MKFMNSNNNTVVSYLWLIFALVTAFTGGEDVWVVCGLLMSVLEQEKFNEH